MQSAVEYYNEVNLSNLKTKTSPAFADIEWKERGPNNVGGRTRAILFLSAKKVLAAGVTGGLWKTEDITASNPNWKQVNPFGMASINITCIAQDPNNNSVLYFGTGEAFGSMQVGSGIYKSTDGGENWTILSNTAFTGPSSNFSYISKILVASNSDIYATTKGYYCNVNGGLMKSTDGGASWTRVIGTNGTTCTNGTDLTGADIEENSAGDLFFTSAGPSGHIYISNKSIHGNNVGNTGNWTDITPSGTWKNIEIGVSKQSGSGVIYAACQGSASYDVTGIYYSNSKGSSWTSRSIPTICDQGNNSVFTRNQAWYDLVVEIDPSNDNIAYLGGIDLVKTADAGATFSQITTWSLYWPNPSCSGSTPPYLHADQHALVFNPYTSNAALSGNDGGLSYSTNMNASIPSWTSKNTGYNVTQYYAIATHPSQKDYVLGGTQDNGSHKLSFYGIGSGSQISGGDGGFCHILQSNATYQTSSYVYNNFYVSSNSGSSFISQSGSNSTTGRFVNPSELDDANALVFSAGNSNILEVRSGLTSGTFTRSTFNLGFNNRQLSALKVSPNNTDVVYVGDDRGNIYKITSRASTPVKATWGGNVGTTGYISSIDVWKSQSGADDSILVTISNYGTESVFLTSNGTNTTPTWVDIDDNNTLQDMPVRWGIFSKESSNKIFIATDLGVMGTQSINGNSTPWTLINNNMMPYVRVDMLDYDSDDNLVIASHGRGIWETQQPCNLSSPIPTTAGTYPSQITRKDGKYVCFCTADGELLLAMDTLGSGIQFTQDAIALQIEGSGSSTISWNGDGGIITNTDGAAIIDRKWNSFGVQQPDKGPVSIQFPFTPTEYSNLQTACASLSPSTTITNPNQLDIYTMGSPGFFSDPHGTGATGSILNHGASPSTSNWTHTTRNGNHIAEFETNSVYGGGIGGGANSTGLPVDLIEFTANRLSQNEAILLWKTASEDNNKGFEIERSYNGSRFENIGWRDASLNPNQVNSYFFIDNDLSDSYPVAYYRLKQLDINGNYEYSEIRVLHLGPFIENIKLYPNPAIHTLTVGMNQSISNLEVYTLTGHLLAKTNHAYKLDVSSLSPGMYIASIRTGEKNYYRRFIKQ